ncbi:MAG: hypothetical protein V1661_00945 [bacterium]
MKERLKIAMHILAMLGSFALFVYIVFLGVSAQQHDLPTALGLAAVIFLAWRGFSRFKYDYNAFLLKKFHKVK